MDLLKHNQDTYNELMRSIEYNSRVGVVQCTGSGKGAIATKLITDGLKQYKILLLAPRKAILTNYLLSFGIKSNDRILLTTYQSICMSDIEELERLGAFADILILDEYHRCGADKWGTAANVLIDCVEKHGGKIIGFTATPKRYLDNERDMTEELFNGVCIEGVDLTSAIKKGILPVFTYIKARYGFAENVKEYYRYLKLNKTKGKIENNKLALVSDNDKYIHDIIRNETKDLKGCQKWIVFCNSIKELNDLCNHIPKWFDVPVNIFISHSKMSPDLELKNDIKFRESRKGINLLLTVDKYNEGVHLSDISGVIMLRQTLSPIIFLQQLGRALSAGNMGQTPIIFDLVSNIDNIQNYEDIIMSDLNIMAEEVNKYAERKAKKNSSKGGKIILKSYCEDIDKVLNEISKVVGRKWSKEEDAIIIENYPTMKKEVSKLLDGRSQDAVYQRARYLGLIDSREWTRKEDNIIRKYYPKEGVGVIARLEKRTEIAVKARASVLKVRIDRKNCWTQDDDDFLIRKFGKDRNYPMQDAVRILNNKFTPDEIYARLKYLDVSHNRLEEWTSMEDAYLRLAWGNVSKKEIEQKLNRHTVQAIYSRAKRLGLIESTGRNTGNNGRTIWTPFEEGYLIECYKELGPKVYGIFPDRSRRAVDTKIYELKIKGVIPPDDNRKRS